MTLDDVFTAVGDLLTERGRIADHVEVGSEVLADLIAEVGWRCAVVIRNTKAMASVFGPTGRLTLDCNDALCDHIIVVDSTGDRWPY